MRKIDIDSPTLSGDDVSSYLIKPMLHNQSVVDQMIQRITDAIIAGDLQPGQKIPTELELCEAFQVGRNSVREAIKVLISMGVLEIRRSEGTFVCDGFSNRMLDPMVYGLILEGGSSYKMIELRRIFDTGILQLAVDKADEKDLRVIRDTLNRLRIALESGTDENAIHEADLAFHKALEKTLDNPLVDMVSMVINRLTVPTRLTATRAFLKKDQRREFYALHEQLYKIVAERDCESISKAMDVHFQYWRDELAENNPES